MERKTQKLLFSLLRSAVEDKPMVQLPSISKGLFAELIAMADKHDLLHLLDYAFRLNGLKPNSKEQREQLRSATLSAVCRYERMQYEYKRVCTAFGQADMAFLPLKGVWLRERYPEPWMRTSSDVDILVREELLSKAVALLSETYGYTALEENMHDVSMFAPGKQHIELHYCLVESGLANDSETVLRDVWQTATLCEDIACCYKMSDEMFYLYHIAHMAKHFQNGGCGIRPFLDLWLMDRTDAITRERRDSLLQKARLLTFAESVRKLCRAWFENERMDETMQDMENYILRGGVYGTVQNRIVVQQHKHGGRLRYIFSRVCLSFHELQHYYPVLKKHRWLMPIMQVRRWCGIVFGGGFSRTMNELKTNRSVSKETSTKMHTLLCNVGLIENE